MHPPPPAKIQLNFILSGESVLLHASPTVNIEEKKTVLVR